MSRARHGDSLAERAARSGVTSPQEAASEAPAAGTRSVGRGLAAEGRARHCWVRDPPDAPGRWPGLLVEWRHREGGWQGRVAYTVTGDNGPVLLEAWLPAAQLEQS